ncbi:MFS general substrate transporter [Zopfia rhizophila CBS 207.26]|uniref:MFS general substrate transporter n=1 Tax=Zopfia rhizophila CBS 207.26 TaxID=1314779 RepID=A0A6A6E623_9PEZI|nr:MFS general substrate transporter [Zopfia rhizophila CBS 207.26]
MAGLFQTYVDLHDNEERQIDNPLAHIEDLYALDRDAKAFAHRIDPESPDEDLWVKAARVGRDPLGVSPTTVPKLTTREYNILKNQRQKGFWRQPKALRVTIATLCLGGIMQGWTQTGGNGANQTWPEEFGMHPPNGKWENHRALWIFSSCNAVTYLAAGIFGCWLSDPLQSWLLGRKGAFFVSCLLILSAVIGGACSHAWETYMACRVILGLGMGAKASVVPIMGAEVSPPHLRGALVMNWQFMDALGIFLGFTANLVVSKIGPLTWRFQTASAALPTICALSLIPAIPESPRFYLKKGKLREAFQVLLDLRGSQIQAATELYYMNAQIQAEVSLLPRRLSDAESNGQSTSKTPSTKPRNKLRRRAADTWNAISRHVPNSELDTFQRRIKKTSYFTRLWQLFRDKRTFRATVAAFVVMAGQQLCGINVLAFYSSTFFEDLNNDRLGSLWLSWGLGAANFIFTLPVYWFIDKRGRRFILLFWSYPGMFFSLLAACLSFYIKDEIPRQAVVTLWIFCFFFFYSVGQGPVPFAYSSEVFPLLNREQGMSFAVFVNLFGAGLLTLFVPTVSDAIGQSRLLGIFAGLNVLSFILIFFLVPETAGATLGKEEGSLNYISLEELNYIFGVSTKKHVRYQVQRVLPWAGRWIKWFVQRRLLFRGDAREPDELEELYTWVSVRNLNKEKKQQQQENQVVGGQEEDEIMSQPEWTGPADMEKL